MNRGNRRDQTEKIARKRLKKLLTSMQPRGAETREEAQSRQLLIKGHLRKYNLACGCAICKKPRWKDRGNIKREKTLL